MSSKINRLDYAKLTCSKKASKIKDLPVPY